MTGDDGKKQFCKRIQVVVKKIIVYGGVKNPDAYTEEKREENDFNVNESHYRQVSLYMPR